MMKFKKALVFVFAGLSVIALSGCKDNDAEHVVGQWSGSVETNSGNAISVDTIKLNITEEDNFIRVDQHVNSTYKREGIRDRNRNTENTYNLVMLSENEIGEPGVGETPETVIYTYDESADAIVYKHTMFDGIHEVMLSRE